MPGLQRNVTVRFPVTVHSLARAMATAASEHEPLQGLPMGDEGSTEAPEFTAFVNAMSERQAVTALRDYYMFYGTVGYPDDYPRAAFAAAKKKARAWISAPHDHPGQDDTRSNG